MANCGSVWVHDTFLFSDGTTGKKIFIVLGLGTHYVVCKTTSKENIRRKKLQGCQLNDSYFFIPLKEKIFEDGSSLDKDTWVQFDELYKLDPKKVLSDGFNKIIRPLGNLKRETFAGLLNCIMRSEDVTGEEKDILMAAKKSL